MDRESQGRDQEGMSVPPHTEGLLEATYDDLRRLASRYLSRSGPGHTLQPTALVHEAWLKMDSGERGSYASRSHFLAASARTMRHVLVNHARDGSAAKRGGGRLRVTLQEGVALYEDRCLDLIALDEALLQLSQAAARQAHIVELRFFGGLSFDEIAELLDVSCRTVERGWRSARAWLRTEIASADDRTCTPNNGNG